MLIRERCRHRCSSFFFFQAEDGIRDHCVTGVQTCALPILVSLRVGVSKPMLYEYFNSKEGLLLACVARIRADLQEATVRAVASAAADGSRAVLEAGLEAYFDFADRHGRAWAVLLNESVIVAGPAEEAIEAIRGQQTELMEAMLASWLVDAPPVRIAVFAHSLIGASERVARWRLRDGAGGPLGPRGAAVMPAHGVWAGVGSAAESGKRPRLPGTLV